MKRIINFDQKRRSILFDATAREMKVSNVVIEKDFWVCAVLNYLVNESQYKDYFIFKGGTSLSKCYDVIKRFSEDVDLILKWDTIGFTDKEVYEERSKNQDYKFEIEMNERGASFIQNEIKKDLEDNFASKIDGASVESDPNDPMVLYVNYPASYQNDYIVQRVKLEIGPVAAKTPTEIKEIEPYCFKSFHVENKSPFKVNIVSIKRTFWEKLLILYAECNRPADKKTPARYSRHFYDVFMIYKSNFFPLIMEDTSLFYEVKTFKSKYYRTSWSKLEECQLSSIQIVPNAERLNDIAKDYQSMSEMIFSDKPSFEEIVNGLHELEQFLRSIR